MVALLPGFPGARAMPPSRLTRRRSLGSTEVSTPIRRLPMGETLTLTAEDGHKLSAYKATPSGAPRGAIVVVQEIFGVNQHIRKLADGFAADGYVAVAPALFDRVERGYETGYGPQDIERGRATRGKLSLDQSMMDVKAAVKELAKGGQKVGVVGYCFGGTIAWLAGTRPDGGSAAGGHDGGGKAEDGRHAALRRDRRVDPQGSLREGQEAPPERSRVRLSRGARIRVRRARLVSRGVGEAGARAHDGVLQEAPRDRK